MTQPVYRLIADTPRSQAQSIRSVIVISGHLLVITVEIYL